MKANDFLFIITMHGYIFGACSLLWRRCVSEPQHTLAISNYELHHLSTSPSERSSITASLHVIDYVITPCSTIEFYCSHLLGYALLECRTWPSYSLESLGGLQAFRNWHEELPLPTVTYNNYVAYKKANRNSQDEHKGASAQHPSIQKLCTDIDKPTLYSLLRIKSLPSLEEIMRQIPRISFRVAEYTHSSN